MMKILKALFISAVATGLAAAVLNGIGVLAPRALPPARRGAGPEVDAERLPQAQRDLLLQELDSQL